MVTLPRSAPLDQDVDPAAVLALLDALEADPGIEMHSLMVVRHGHVVAEGWWAPYTPQRRHLLYSLSKSVTAAAAAFAQAEGLIDLDDPVSDYVDVDVASLSPRSRAMRLRDVASMASGHTADMAREALARDPHDPVRGLLLTPPERDPGTVFAYNQPCTYALAAAVQRRAGMPLTAYLRPRLFDPLGIGEVGWHAWPPGSELGFTGLHARTEDVAKLGLLHLQQGRWGDRQLLPQEWVAEATRVQVATPDEPNPDWRQGYGFQFWRGRHGYRGDGAFGQLCVVLPEQRTVVATTACTERVQAVLDALWEHLLPGLGREGGEEDAQAELAGRLAALRLPPRPVGVARPAPPPGTAATFTVVRGVVGGYAQSGLESVTAARSSGGGLELTLAEPDNALTFPVGRGEWAVSEPADRTGATVPVAACEGGDGEVLRVDVLFLETPHRLEVSLSPQDGAAVALWSQPPLGGDRITHLHSP